VDKPNSYLLENELAILQNSGRPIPNNEAENFGLKTAEQY